ncbi:hypothetical protein ACIQK6_23930 [Streptomyces sp. NPDC091682]|uniref:hypothetical protein n=1 Tax=unclassified Streptomyces TaxID=2593676 RepID=UPI0037192DD0
MAGSKIRNESEVLGWFRDGWTYTQMQKYYREVYNEETSIPMWAAFRRRRGLDRRNLRADDLIPWKVKPEHRHKYPAIMLRAEARLRAENDALSRGDTPARPVSDRDKQRLASWKKDLTEDGLVVHYDPDTSDGFFLVPREEQDSDLIRAPKEKTGNQARD